MIKQVGSPCKTPKKWVDFILKANEAQFGPHTGIVAAMYWWFVYMKEGEVAGFGGCKREFSRSMLLGPCVVFEEFRGQGIQREFISHREKFAKRLGFKETMGYVDFDNYPSINNFMRSGYLICEPWRPHLDNDGRFIYCKKALCQDRSKDSRTSTHSLVTSTGPRSHIKG